MDADEQGAAPAEGTQAGRTRILVWDLPTRAFHWLLAGSFAGAWLLSESERWRHVHVGLGFAVLALVALRIVWGFVGTRHARFAEFAFRPRAAFEYARSLLARRPTHCAGHNPLGGLAITAMLVLAVATGVTGWLYYAGVGGEEAFEELHEVCATLWLALVGVHLAGVLVGSLAERDNLPRAMLTGRKAGVVSDAIDGPRTAVGVVVAAIAVAAYAWGSGVFGTPPGAPGVATQDAARGTAPAVARGRAADEDDDD